MEKLLLTVCQTHCGFIIWLSLADLALNLLVNFVNFNTAGKIIVGCGRSVWSLHVVIKVSPLGLLPGNLASSHSPKTSLVHWQFKIVCVCVDVSVNSCLSLPCKRLATCPMMVSRSPPEVMNWWSDKNGWMDNYRQYLDFYNLAGIVVVTYMSVTCFYSSVTTNNLRWEREIKNRLLFLISLGCRDLNFITIWLLMHFNLVLNFIIDLCDVQYTFFSAFF